jgi:hypothetical protein
MLPGFLLEETTVRESGEGAILDLGENTRNPLLLIFSITHAVEQENIILEVYGSKDGESWLPRPIASFPPKCYCGDYQMAVSSREVRYLKAIWRVTRWGKGDRRPYFRFFIFAQTARSGVAMAGAA